MAEIPLDELMSRAKSQIENKKPNAAIIAQLTSGKERRRPLYLQDVGRWQDSGVDLIVHVSVDFIWRESIAIGILRRTERSTTGFGPCCGPEPETLEFGYQNEVLRNEQLTTPYEAQLFALSLAMASTHKTIRDSWPKDVALNAVKFRIGLTKPDPRPCIAASVTKFVRRWGTKPKKWNKRSERVRSILKQIPRIKAAMVRPPGSSIMPVYFEDEYEQTSACRIAGQKQKALQSAPQMGKRWQRPPRVTKAQKRVGEIVQDYKARTDPEAMDGETWSKRR